MNLKTTISTTSDIYDANSQWLPKGNYYFTIEEIRNGTVKGQLKDRSLCVTYEFNYVMFIRMMSNAQARLARRANITSPNMPDILSPKMSPHRSTPNVLHLNCFDGVNRVTSINTRSESTLPSITQVDAATANSVGRRPSTTTVLSNSMQEEKCAICLEARVQGRNLRNITTLVCNHQFHKNCIDRWTIRKTTCPVCRRRIKRTGTRTRQNRSSRYVIRNTNRTSRYNNMTSLPAIEDRYNLRRNRYYRNLSNV